MLFLIAYFAAASFAMFTDAATVNTLVTREYSVDCKGPILSATPMSLVDECLLTGTSESSSFNCGVVKTWNNTNCFGEPVAIGSDVCEHIGTMLSFSLGCEQMADPIKVEFGDYRCGDVAVALPTISDRQVTQLDVCTYRDTITFDGDEDSFIVNKLPEGLYTVKYYTKANCTGTVFSSTAAESGTCSSPDVEHVGFKRVTVTAYPPSISTQAPTSGAGDVFVNRILFALYGLLAVVLVT